VQVTIVGGGVGGLLTAMLLGNDGHEVTVLERDPTEPPESPTAAWEAWERRGVNQFRLLHFFAPQFRRLLEAELPGAVAALEEAGALRFNPMALAPESLTGGYQPGDEDFEALTARRPVAEASLARTAAAMPNVSIRRGIGTAGLLAGFSSEGSCPRVIGVRLDDGEELASDLVVDASGRRSQLPAWLAAIGARPSLEEVEDSGFIYYGRHFRSADGSVPVMLSGLLTAAGSVSLLSLPADNGTWGLGIITSAGDAALRRLKDPDTWTRVARSFPLHAHWTDGEPLDDVAVMAKIEDRHRCYVVDGAPVATGVVAVADAWACTNPSLGRGASLGFMHAIALRDTLRTVAAEDPTALALAFHAATEATVEPWYRATVSFDRHRLHEMEATARGESYEPGDPAWEITQAMQAAVGFDPEVFRAFVRIVSVLTPGEEVLARPSLLRKVMKLGSGWRDAPVLGPTRSELLELVGA
jgi:2-polyprenyl-6-methoxyphenol hydroxylase-like FAD-dependent oxidoreductase